MRTTRGRLVHNVALSAIFSALSGAIISVVVNNALIEISLTPFFAGVFGLVLLLLGALMVWRKLWDSHDAPCTRVLVLGFSSLVLFSGVSCFLLEKDWFMRISPAAKVPMYVSLGISLSFAVTFTLVDLINVYHDRHSYGYADLRTRSAVSSPQQVAVVLAGSVAMGACYGLLFGAMDVEDDRSRNHERLRTEERASLPIGLVLGGVVGAVNAVLAARAELDLGEQIDLLRAEGLHDDGD